MGDRVLNQLPVDPGTNGESARRDTSAPSKPSGQLMTMPILVLNMGGEMIYILEQRLQAQKVPSDKCKKVLNDVVCVMHDSRFVQELFRPQAMYSMQAARPIFDRLAQASIMRLNQASMDRLFDLMTMVFKYEVMACTSPTDLVDITQNHFEGFRRLAGSDPSVHLLDACAQKLEETYSKMSLADLNATRQALCCALQDRKVRTTTLLQKKMQDRDGSIVVPSVGTLPAGANKPGSVRYFTKGKEVRRDQHAVVSAENWFTGVGKSRSRLGTNMFNEKHKVPLQLFAQRDEGRLTVTCSNLAGEVLGQFTDMSPARKLSALTALIHERVPPPPVSCWQLVLPNATCPDDSQLNTTDRKSVV